jgi:hypothetical protein
MLRGGWVVIGLLVLAACSSHEVRHAHTVDLVTAAETIPENRLLDVAILEFDAGIENEEEAVEDGIFPQVRRAEARFLSVHLRDTLQQSGHWGAVRVTPLMAAGSDLVLMGRIEESDGDRVELAVEAVDAAGRVWLDKAYKLETAAGSYDERRYPGLDPYQDLFNMIANDLATQRATLTAKELEEIRTVAQLRYAAELTPDAYDGYLELSRAGRYQIRRLPAEGDPNYERMGKVLEREHAFVDTLNEYYAQFYTDIGDSYDNWRKFAREEAINMRELKSQARWRTGMGIAAIAAAILYDSNSSGGSTVDRVLRDVAIYGGMEAIKSGMGKRAEAKMHQQALEELGSGFDAEVAPVVVEFQGTTHRLTGAAEAQYQEWRRLLRELYMAETGLISDMAIYSEPEVSGGPVLPTEIDVLAGVTAPSD